MANASNPSTQEVDAERSESKVILGYILSSRRPEVSETPTILTPTLLNQNKTEKNILEALGVNEEDHGVLG